MMGLLFGASSGLPSSNGAHGHAQRQRIPSVRVRSFSACTCLTRSKKSKRTCSTVFVHPTTPERDDASRRDFNILFDDIETHGLKPFQPLGMAHTGENPIDFFPEIVAD